MFILSAVFSINRDDKLLYYIFSIAGFSLALFIVILSKYKSAIKLNNTDSFIFLIFGSLITLGSIYNSEPMGVVLLLMYTTLIIYFKFVKLAVNRLVEVINFTYLLYLFLSIMSYSGLLFQKTNYVLNSFVKDYGVISFETLYGLEGSTAAIDSYSAIVVLLNIFLNKKFSRYFFIFIAVFALLWTTRFTPIVSFILSVFSFAIVRNRFAAVALISAIFIGFFSFSFIEIYYPNESFFVPGVTNKTLLQLATHGRTFIWAQQVKSIALNFNVFDYLFGNYEHALVSLPWGGGSNSNSHNSFFNL